MGGAVILKPEGERFDSHAWQATCQGTLQQDTDTLNPGASKVQPVYKEFVHGDQLL